MLKVTIQKQVLKVLKIMPKHGRKSIGSKLWSGHTNQSKCLSIPESGIFNTSMRYHSHCYKNFTATQKPNKNTTQNSYKATTSSQSNPPPPWKSGVLPSLYIFCVKCRKKNQRTMEPSTEKWKAQNKLFFKIKLSQQTEIASRRRSKWYPRWFNVDLATLIHR